MNPLKSLQLNRNKDYSTAKAIRAIEKIFMDEVAKPLNLIDIHDPLAFQRYANSLNELPAKMGEIVETHAKALVRLELIKGEYWSGFDDYKTQRLLNKLLSDGDYLASFENLFGRVKSKLLEHQTVNFDIMREVAKEMQELVISEMYHLRRVMIDEAQTISNTVREHVYKQEEEEFGIKFKYIWSHGSDDRVTDLCKDIKSTIMDQSDGRGLPLDQVKKIVKTKSLSYMGDKYHYRDWKPHYHCRSALIRKVS